MIDFLRRLGLMRYPLVVDAATVAYHVKRSGLPEPAIVAAFRGMDPQRQRLYDLMTKLADGEA